jgi:hypothetical protein
MEKEVWGVKEVTPCGNFRGKNESGKSIDNDNPLSFLVEQRCELHRNEVTSFFV